MNHMCAATPAFRSGIKALPVFSAVMIFVAGLVFFFPESVPFLVWRGSRLVVCAIRSAILGNLSRDGQGRPAVRTRLEFFASCVKRPPPTLGRQSVAGRRVGIPLRATVWPACWKDRPPSWP